MLKRLILTAIVIAAATASPAFATDARTGSMPGAFGLVLDDGDVFIYPSLAPLFYRSLIAELGIDGQRVASSSSLTALYANQEQTYGVIGTAINRASTSHGSLEQYLTPEVRINDSLSISINCVERLQQRHFGLSLPDVPAPGSEYDLLYAKKFGQWTMGARLEWATGAESKSYTGDSREASSSVAGFTLGAGFEPREGFRIDAAVAFASFGFSSQYTLTAADYQESFDSKGSKRLGFNLRSYYTLNDEMTLIPALALAGTNLGYTYAQRDTLHNFSGKTATTDFDAGLGWQYSPTPKFNVLAGVGLKYRRMKSTDSIISGDPGDAGNVTTSVSFPCWQLGLESTAAKWLVIRLGASQKTVSLKEVTDFNDGTALSTKATSNPYALGIGAGIKAAGFLLDLTVNPELVYSGGSIVSGSKTWPVSQASVTYRF
jgi:hypothetical protein